MPDRKCVICGKSYYVTPRMIINGWGKCCSAECRAVKANNRKCQICGKPFHAKLSRIKKGYAKYCSDRCREIGAGKTNSKNREPFRTKVVCVVCGKTKFIKPSHNTKIKNYCSVVCMAEDYKTRQAGALNPNYKDGRTFDQVKYTSAWILAKKKKDPQFRLRINFGLRIYKAIRDKKAGRSWELLVGYTLNDLVKHLKKQFTAGMTWENYGEWHIDHKVPSSAFNYTKPEHEDFKRCWALSNLQPLWAIDNSKKGKVLKRHFQPSLILETNNG